MKNLRIAKYTIKILTALVLLPTGALFALEKANPALVKSLAVVNDSIANKPFIMMAALVCITLLPFIGMMVTSFVKIAVVMSMTRQAIGTQQAPPTTVITGLAIILSVYVMHPVGLEIYRRAETYINQESKSILDKSSIDTIVKVISVAKEPVKEFLLKHATPKNVQMFYRIAYRMRAEPDKANLSPNDFIILVPSFVISELTKAFQIGFIIFLPFLVIDMVVSNILMALGMQMLAPTTISLPFKILLFVMVDGWHLITKGLILGYS